MTPRCLVAGFLIALGAAGLARGSGAAEVIFYPDFSNPTGLNLLGAAGTIAAGAGVALRLTPAAAYQSGAAYSVVPVPLADGFSTAFQFRLTDPNNVEPADGFAFVAAARPTGLGLLGRGLGYEGVANSVAIEFDTYDNGYTDASSSNHIAVDPDGYIIVAAPAFPYGVQDCDASQTGCMSNGDTWTVAIAYGAAGMTLTVQDDANPVQTIYDDFPLDLPFLLGTNTAYLGFAGGTGGFWQEQDILSWRAETTTPVFAPEPSGALVIASALAGFAGLRRRTRPSP
jgi:hypothetical protein